MEGRSVSASTGPHVQAHIFAGWGSDAIAIPHMGRKLQCKHSHGHRQGAFNSQLSPPLTRPNMDCCKIDVGIRVVGNKVLRRGRREMSRGQWV